MSTSKAALQARFETSKDPYNEQPAVVETGGVYVLIAKTVYVVAAAAVTQKLDDRDEQRQQQPYRRYPQ
ncbi:hypothetical protein D9Q98_010417 [Chlorella vulgaris]|uniref:Uncharacterized protein n=1 Tax=Chlorella vulgaris TaxID=3077 RepID=A0A9D4YYK3_CHLVU|nr:hypothetical protein D9Q98_010417 [Chlorella vulgaris]